jgi:ribosomal protein S18 acetylase RimI-like enzyme
MMCSLDQAGAFPPSRAAQSFVFESWHERFQDEAAHLIADAYYGHVDSQINDQYRSVAGARRFLLNIVQYPGCGSFYQPASFLALHPTTHRVCGVALASVVSGEVGHITQICVSPSLQGHGIGYELMRLAMTSLQSKGFREASLTVTAQNTGALHLYERLGFQPRREFSAFVWDETAKR